MLRSDPAPALMANTDSNYTALSKFLHQHHSDFSLYRFRELNIRSLLFYQAELAHLQRDLEQIEKLDAAKHTDLDKRVTYRWNPNIIAAGQLALSQHNTLSPKSPTTSAPRPEGSYGDIYVLKIKEIRETLAKYSSLFTSKFERDGSSPVLR